MTEVINEEVTPEVITPETQNEEVVEGEGTETTAVETAGEVTETPEEKVVREEKKRKQLELQTKEDLLRRIDKITKDKYDLLEREEHWKRKALERGQEQSKPAEVIPEDVKPARPNPKNFPDEFGNVDFDAYTAALDAHDAEVEQWKLRQWKKQEAQERQATEARIKKENFDKQGKEISKVKPDFWEKVMDESLPYTPITAAIMLESDNSAALALHFAENPAELERLSKLPPAKATLEMGKIEFKISQNPAPARKVSSAPEPLNIVSGKDAVRKNPSDMTDEEYFKYRKQLKIAKLKGR